MRLAYFSLQVQFRRIRNGGVKEREREIRGAKEDAKGMGG